MSLRTPRKPRVKKKNYAEVPTTHDYTQDQPWEWRCPSHPEVVRVVFRDSPSSQSTSLPPNALNGEEGVTVYVRGQPHLTLRPSTVKGAGLGLFAARSFRTGDTITHYLGPDGRTEYAMALSTGIKCPARELPYAFAHYINSKPPRGLGGSNVVVKAATGAIEAIYDMDVGTELFHYYGAAHPMY